MNNEYAKIKACRRHSKRSISERKSFHIDEKMNNSSLLQLSNHRTNSRTTARPHFDQINQNHLKANSLSLSSHLPTSKDKFNSFNLKPRKSSQQNKSQKSDLFQRNNFYQTQSKVYPNIQDKIKLLLSIMNNRRTINKNYTQNYSFINQSGVNVKSDNFRNPNNKSNNFHNVNCNSFYLKNPQGDLDDFQMTQSIEFEEGDFNNIFDQENIHDDIQYNDNLYKNINSDDENKLEYEFDQACKDLQIHIDKINYHQMILLLNKFNISFGANNEELWKEITKDSQNKKNFLNILGKFIKHHKTNKIALKESKDEKQKALLFENLESKRISENDEIKNIRINFNLNANTLKDSFQSNILQNGKYDIGKIKKMLTQNPLNEMKMPNLMNNSNNQGIHYMKQQNIKLGKAKKIEPKKLNNTIKAKNSNCFEPSGNSTKCANFNKDYNVIIDKEKNKNRSKITNLNISQANVINPKTRNKHDSNKFIPRIASITVNEEKCIDNKKQGLLQDLINILGKQNEARPIQRELLFNRKYSIQNETLNLENQIDSANSLSKLNNLYLKNDISNNTKRNSECSSLINKKYSNYNENNLESIQIYVNLDSNKKDLIVIKQGESPKEVAKKFALKHGTLIQVLE